MLCCAGEHGIQLCPICHICFLEDGFCAAGGEGVFCYQSLCFWAESEVCDYDVAAFLEELLGEAEIYAGASSGNDSGFGGDVHRHCVEAWGVRGWEERWGEG